MSLERRICTKEHPMPLEEMRKYQWGHPDARKSGEFFNLWLYTCPNCGITFHDFPNEERK
jgi:hypothetical protein